MDTQPPLFEKNCIFRNIFALPEMPQCKYIIFYIAIFFTLISLAATSNAAAISYSISTTNGGKSEYRYIVTNEVGEAPIKEFTIYFDKERFNYIGISTSPLSWDSIIVQPDTSIPADGFFDSLALDSGIQAGSSVSGFSVFFEVLNGKTFGSQRFEIVDPSNFSVISSGLTSQFTSEEPPRGVPEPSTLALIALAFTVLYRSRIAKMT